MGEAPLFGWCYFFRKLASVVSHSSCSSERVEDVHPVFIPFRLDDQHIFIAAGLRSVWGYCGGTEGALLGDCPPDPGSNLIQILFKVKLTSRET